MWRDETQSRCRCGGGDPIRLAAAIMHALAGAGYDTLRPQSSGALGYSQPTDSYDHDRPGSASASLRSTGTFAANADAAARRPAARMEVADAPLRHYAAAMALRARVPPVLVSGKSKYATVRARGHARGYVCVCVCMCVCVRVCAAACVRACPSPFRIGVIVRLCPSA